MRVCVSVYDCMCVCVCVMMYVYYVCVTEGAFITFIGGHLVSY